MTKASLVQLLGIMAITQVAKCQPTVDPNGFWGVFHDGCLLLTTIGSIGLYNFDDCQTFANQADTFTGPVHQFSGIESGSLDCYQENLGNCAVFWCGGSGDVPSGNDLSASIETIFDFGSGSGANANCIGMAYYNGQTEPSLPALLCLGDTTTGDALDTVARQYNEDLDTQYACGSCGNPSQVAC